MTKTVGAVMITLDRPKVTPRVFKENAAKSGAAVEYFLIDNGSTKLNAQLLSDEIGADHYIRWNEGNTGIYSAWNLGLAEALKRGHEYIAFLGNDIELPQDWAKHAIRTIDAIIASGRKPGVGCFFWGYQANQKSSQIVKLSDGLSIDQRHGTFGSAVIHKSLVDAIGYYDERYNPYGLGDSDYHQRARFSGHVNYYFYGIAKSKHVGEDVGTKSDYREMKNRSMRNNLALFNELAPFWKKGEKLFVK